ncbi:hypothetical protein KEM55_001764 [Ascosphaera atra]|nr:hypothetical protein KEM55_001764 [Ascosphaera atra]
MSNTQPLSQPSYNDLVRRIAPLEAQQAKEAQQHQAQEPQPEEEDDNLMMHGAAPEDDNYANDPAAEDVDRDNDDDNLDEGQNDDADQDPEDSQLQAAQQPPSRTPSRSNYFSTPTGKIKHQYKSAEKKRQAERLRQQREMQQATHSSPSPRPRPSLRVTSSIPRLQRPNLASTPSGARTVPHTRARSTERSSIMPQTPSPAPRVRGSGLRSVTRKNYAAANVNIPTAVIIKLRSCTQPSYLSTARIKPANTVCEQIIDQTWGEGFS